MKLHHIIILLFSIILLLCNSQVEESEKKKAKNNRRSLVLNEDNSHFFQTRTGDEMTIDALKVLVDHYVKGIQVRQLMFCPNSMCASYASEVWDPICQDYDDPEAAKKAGASNWQVNALLLHKIGIDPYVVWIAYRRELGVSPWLSMRMNDVHNVDDPNSYMKRNWEWMRLSGQKRGC